MQQMCLRWLETSEAYSSPLHNDSEFSMQLAVFTHTHTHLRAHVRTRVRAHARARPPARCSTLSMIMKSCRIFDSPLVAAKRNTLLWLLSRDQPHILATCHQLYWRHGNLLPPNSALDPEHQCALRAPNRQNRQRFTKVKSMLVHKKRTIFSKPSKSSK